MSAQKFDEFDRQETIRAVEQRLGIRLSQVGSRRKFFIDEASMAYVVLGGYGDWHGIPKDILADAGKRPAGKLVVAKRLAANILVYCAALATLLENEHRLPVTRASERHFNLGWSAGHPHIREIRELPLTFLMDILYPEQAREGHRRDKKIRQALAALSAEQREALLKSLRQPPS